MSSFLVVCGLVGGGGGADASAVRPGPVLPRALTAAPARSLANLGPGTRGLEADHAAGALPPAPVLTSGPLHSGLAVGRGGGPGPGLLVGVPLPLAARRDPPAADQ